MLRIAGATPLRGEVTAPGDKSISHRAAMLGAVAAGRTTIRNYSPGKDCASTLRCVSALGAEVRDHGGGTVVIEGAGPGGLREPADVLDCANSGTTMRLLAGILAGQPFLSVLTGDPSLRARPMRRISDPLCLMGARVYGRAGGSLAPLAILGGGLRGLAGYRMPVASAQVKSCILLAGLFAEGRTDVVEPIPSRDHTERMLRQFGASLTAEGTCTMADGTRAAADGTPIAPDATRITLDGPQSLAGAEVTVPGDISSAAFWLVAAAIAPGSDVTVRNTGANPLRSGALAVLRRMGCDITVSPKDNANQAEPAADMRVRTSRLRATQIGADEVPMLLDELPVLAVAAALANGRTVVTGAGELRHKETDRISAIVANLQAMGVEATESGDGFSVEGTGGRPLRGSSHIVTHGDHRIAMAFAVAGLAADGETTIDDGACIDVSYPGFGHTLSRLAGRGREIYD